MYPTNDYVFKRIFGMQGNEEITKGFLNSFMSTPVKTIRLDSNPIQMKDLKDDKISILDVKAVINEYDEKQITNIEMQVVNEHNMEKRF